MPYIKTGGLADVTGALLKEYLKSGVEAYLVLPLYRRIKQDLALTNTGRTISVALGNRRVSGRIFSHGKSSFFIECNEFFGRPELYGTPEGDYPDNAARFAFFDRAILEACIALGLRPDVIHCNDWQTGLLPLYLKTTYASKFFKGTATLMTIHNLGYQGLFKADEFALTGVPPEWFTPEGIEFYGKVNFLKAGIISSDIITTVSGTYAREILTPEYGCGLEGVLRNRSSDLYGVVNGIDTEEWDPWRDRLIPSTYGLTDVAGKAVCKRELLKECSFRTVDKDAPLIAFIGRLSAQKGLDLIVDSAEEILSGGSNLVILGKGDEQIQNDVVALSKKHKGRMFIKVGYDEAFAHRIYAGSDIFLMPSRYEPCGLGQLIAMRYGTIPVARRTGGLADTIRDYQPLKCSGTGFLFDEYSSSSFKECVRSALCAYTDKRKWKKVIVNAMGEDFSWESSAKEYNKLYESAVKSKGK